MRRRIAQLVAGLRRSGLAVSVAEAIDAAHAAGVADLERATLRDALAATLVKDERDRPLFEHEFERVFPARAPAGARVRRRERGRTGGEEGASDAGTGRGGGGIGAAVSPGRVRTSASAEEKRAEMVARAPTGASTVAESGAAEAGGRRAEERRMPLARTVSAEPVAATAEASDRLARRRRERALMATPFRAMSAREVEEAAELVRSLAARFRARLRRRLRPRPRGRLDFRRTIRKAIPSGGVPFRRSYRGRRPGKLDLVALCDLSGSTATASDFFLALLAPAVDYFAHVRLFGFVDHLVEIEFVEGQVRPAAPLDLMARSDLGRVLAELMAGPGEELTARTVLLVLGDARNNRRPPRADLLAMARSRVRTILWLNPEPVTRWNTGDSVIGLYARYVDAVVPCGTLAELERALAAVARL